MPTQSHHPSKRTKKSQWGTDADPGLTTKWIQFYVEKIKRVPDWWREFRSICSSKDEHYNNAQVKELAHQQAHSLQAASQPNGKRR